MAGILILYYSRTGTTEAPARAVAEGVESIGEASAKLIRLDYATVHDFVNCGAVGFGSPNYFETMKSLHLLRLPSDSE